jgi:tRNA(fMet)-specific endonuclease VapC
VYLIDTNILSELVKKTPNDNLIVKINDVPSASLYTASVCVMELRYGALRRGNPEDLWLNIQQRIVSKVRILDFSYNEAMKAGEVLYELYSIGQPIGIEDIMIGSIALSHGLTVVTANTKHFSRIPNLRVENWFL